MVRGLYTHHKVCKDRKEFANYDGSKERSSLTDTEDETPLVPSRCFMNGDYTSEGGENGSVCPVDTTPGSGWTEEDL